MTTDQLYLIDALYKRLKDGDVTSAFAIAQANPSIARLMAHVRSYIDEQTGQWKNDRR